MSLLSKFFDRVAAPAPIVDQLGRDAYAKNSIDRILSRSDFLAPLGLTTSVLAVMAATGSTDLFISQAVDAAMGILLHQVIEPVLEEKRWQSKTPYYLDRTKRSLLHPVSDKVLSELYRLQTKGRTSLAIDSGMACTVWGLETAFLGAPSLFALALFSAPVARSFSAYRRASKALSREWRILETLPKQEHKADSRAPVGRTAPAP